MKEAGWEWARQGPAHHGTPIVIRLFKKVSKPDCGLRGKLDYPMAYPTDLRLFVKTLSWDFWSHDGRKYLGDLCAPVIYNVLNIRGGNADSPALVDFLTPHPHPQPLRPASCWEGLGTDRWRKLHDDTVSNCRVYVL